MPSARTSCGDWDEYTAGRSCPRPRAIAGDSGKRAGAGDGPRHIWSAGAVLGDCHLDRLHLVEKPDLCARLPGRADLPVLVWRSRDELARTTAKPWWPGLVVVLLCGVLWLVMSSANVLGLKQFALAFMIQASIVTVLGLRVARVLLFPLAFLLFAIPAGEFLVPVLMDWTADFTVAAIRWSGVPVFREGNHFALPSGNWSIVEACSGIRYLVASVMVGTIYAALAYRSVKLRAAFLVASIVVPIVANWLRAYGIVMIGHLSNNQLAVGVDHIVYGWLFF